MKALSTKLNPTRYRLEIEADPDLVKSKFKEVIKRIAKEAKVKGFRPGCAPLALVEKYYQEEINSKVLQELIPNLIKEAEKQTGLEILETSEIEDIDLQKDRLSFKAYVEVMPEIKLKDYRKIKIDCPKLEIKEEEISNALQKMKEAQRLDSIDDSFAHLFGCKDLEELKNVMEKEFFLEKFHLRYEQIRNQIIDYLLKDINIDLPKTLVNQRKEILMKETKRQWLLKGLSEEDFLKNQEKINAELEKTAQEQTKVYLVFLQIAKKENIPLDGNFQAEVMKFLLKEAEWKGTF